LVDETNAKGRLSRIAVANSRATALRRLAIGTLSRKSWGVGAHHARPVSGRQFFERRGSQAEGVPHVVVTYQAVGPVEAQQHRIEPFGRWIEMRQSVATAKSGERAGRVVREW